MIRSKSERTLEIIKRLKKAYPTAHCALNHTRRVRVVDRDDTLRAVHRSACEYRHGGLVSEISRAAGFCGGESVGAGTGYPFDRILPQQGEEHPRRSQRILDEFGGQVPNTMPEILSLAGVARKTANVVLGNAFGIASGVVVDTHVSRLSQRLGLTKEKTPEKIERDLQKLVPKNDWVMFSHWLIFHGRQICQARKPKCTECVLADQCPSFRIFTKI
jgi:endonuclease-3